jgi:hypothetical protein
MAPANGASDVTTPADNPLSSLFARLLWYMRTCLNAYSRAAGLIPDTPHPRVRPLPVYGATPFPPIPAAF